jgi:hypothetical protein
MVSEWRALKRAGEWAGLEGAVLEDFTVLVADIHNTAIADYSEFENYGQEYFDFLNDEVFSDERVIDILLTADVDEETIETFLSGSVPVKQTFHTKHILDHGLNELVDLIMMLKLVDRYTSKTNQEYIPSRYHFQKLLFQTNLHLKHQETGSIVDSSKFGLLKKTGYRYSFRKRNSGPFAAEAYTDKYRLHASDLLDEDVLANNGTGEVAEHDHTYGIKLSKKGQLLLSRFRHILVQFESDILFYWDRAQERAIEELAGLSVDEIRALIISETDIESRRAGEEVLPPRQMMFDVETEEPDTAASSGVVNNV